MVNYYISLLLYLFYFCQIINSYLIFPLEYLKDINYKFAENNENEPKKVMKSIYFRNIMTNIELETPKQNISLFIKTNSDKCYITSVNNSTINSSAKVSNFYQFSLDEYYNEKISSSYKEGICKINKYFFYPYDEICTSNETLIFHINETISMKKEFPITLVRNLDDNIPGYIGLLHNDLEYESTYNLIIRAKSQKLISNYFWFFNFDKINPLEKNLKGNLIIGGQPHEIYPNKYSYDDLELTSSYKSSFAGRSWRLLVDKIYIENSDENYTKIDGRILTLNHEIYNIITTMEFHNIIKKLFMEELLQENKCFVSNFSQNIYKYMNLSFYYCHKSTKDILYEKMPNLNFKSIALNFIFELTKEELFYEKDNFIYFMIIFANEPNTNWIMGQMFTFKYNFCFNNDIKQIGLYKKLLKETNGKKVSGEGNKDVKEGGISKGTIIAIIAVCEAVLCMTTGIIIGKKLFGDKQRKTRINELENSSGINYIPKDFNFDFIDNYTNENQITIINEKSPIRSNVQNDN